MLRIGTDPTFEADLSVSIGAGDEAISGGRVSTLMKPRALSFLKRVMSLLSIIRTVSNNSALTEIAYSWEGVKFIE